MTPDVVLVLLMVAFTLAAYVFWVTDAQPRFRRLLSVLAVVALVGTVVVRTVEMNHMAAQGEAAVSAPEH